MLPLAQKPWYSCCDKFKNDLNQSYNDWSTINHKNLYNESSVAKGVLAHFDRCQSKFDRCQKELDSCQKDFDRCLSVFEPMSSLNGPELLVLWLPAAADSYQ